MFDLKIVELEAEMRGIAKSHEDKFKHIDHEIHTVIPDSIENSRRDQNSWKERFEKLERSITENDDLQNMKSDHISHQCKTNFKDSHTQFMNVLKEF